MRRFITSYSIPKWALQTAFQRWRIFPEHSDYKHLSIYWGCISRHYEMLIYVFGFSIFFDSIFQITFDCLDQNSHYHIPLLLNPYGYTTYRGSWIHYCAYFESPSPSEIKSSSTTDNFNFMYQIKRLWNELEWTIQRAFSMLFNFIQGIRSIKMRNIIIVYIVWPPFWIGVEPR